MAKTGMLTRPVQVKYLVAIHSSEYRPDIEIWMRVLANRGRVGTLFAAHSIPQVGY